MAILLNGWILPIGGVAQGRVCACSLRIILVYKQKLHVSAMCLAFIFLPKNPLKGDNESPNQTLQSLPFSYTLDILCTFMPNTSLYAANVNTKVNIKMVTGTRKIHVLLFTKQCKNKRIMINVQLSLSQMERGNIQNAGPMKSLHITHRI